MTRASSVSRLGRKVGRDRVAVVAGLRRFARRAWLPERIQESQEERDIVKLLFSMWSAIE